MGKGSRDRTTDRKKFRENFPPMGTTKPTYKKVVTTKGKTTYTY